MHCWENTYEYFLPSEVPLTQKKFPVDYNLIKFDAYWQKYSISIAFEVSFWANTSMPTHNPISHIIASRVGWDGLQDKWRVLRFSNISLFWYDSSIDTLHTPYSRLPKTLQQHFQRFRSLESIGNPKFQINSLFIFFFFLVLKIYRQTFFEDQFK